MTPFSSRQLPLSIRGNGIGCYRDPQKSYGMMGSSPGREENKGCREIKAGFYFFFVFPRKLLGVIKPDPLLDPFGLN